MNISETSKCLSDLLRNLKTNHITISQTQLITETFSPKLSPSSSNPSFQSQILSFDNPPNSSPATNTPQIFGFDPTLNSKQKETESLGNIAVSTQIPKGSSKNQNKRSRGNSHDLIMVERQRREKLSQSFIALAALVPGLKKMDKQYVLTESIKYMKELKERLEVVEKQNKKTEEAEVVVVLDKPELCSDDNSSSCERDAASSLLNVEAIELGKEMLIRIHSKKHEGLALKIMAEIQSFQLFVKNSNVLSFGDSILDITIIAKVDEGYKMSIKELVKNIRMEALAFMSL